MLCIYIQRKYIYTPLKYIYSHAYTAKTHLKNIYTHLYIQIYTQCIQFYIFVTRFLICTYICEIPETHFPLSTNDTPASNNAKTHANTNKRNNQQRHFEACNSRKFVVFILPVSGDGKKRPLESK